MLTIYKLSMTNCVPCRAYAPTFKKVAKEFPEYCWVEVDITEATGESLAKQFAIRSVPATIVIRNGHEGMLSENVKLGNLTEEQLKEFVNVQCTSN